MEIKELSFEKELSRIDEINSMLSNGNLSLDESVKLYEEAASRIQHCRKLLDEAELKITTISSQIHETRE